MPVPYSLPRLGISQARIERYGPVVIGPGPRQIAPFAQDERAIEVTDRRRGIQFDGAIVIRQRAFEVPFGQPRRAAVAPGCGEVGLELDGPRAIGDGAVEISHAITRSTAIVIGF